LILRVVWRAINKSHTIDAWRALALNARYIIDAWCALAINARYIIDGGVLSPMDFDEVSAAHLAFWQIREGVPHNRNFVVHNNSCR
jgi:hypothetical protein